MLHEVGGRETQTAYVTLKNYSFRKPEIEDWNKVAITY